VNDVTDDAEPPPQMFNNHFNFKGGKIMPMKYDEDLTRTCVKLPIADMRWVDQKAEAEGLTRAEVIRRVVKKARLEDLISQRSDESKPRIGDMTEAQIRKAFEDGTLNSEWVASLSADERKKVMRILTV
jgi:hypothetical protein